MKIPYVMTAAVLLMAAVDALAQSQRVEPSHRARHVYHVPSSIRSDCVEDVTAALNDWLGTVPDGQPGAPVTIRFRRSGCYRVDGTLGTPYNETTGSGINRKYLVYDGNGSIIDGSATLPPEGSNRAAFSFMYGTGLTITNFIIKGNHRYACRMLQTDSSSPCTAVGGNAGYDARYEHHHGIAFFASVDVAVVDNHIYDVYGDGVALSQAGSGEHVHTARVENNLIDGTGRMGIGVTAADGVLITRNTFDRASFHVIDLEPEAVNPVKNITILGNTIRRHYLGFVSSFAGECIERSNLAIVGNVMAVSGISSFPAIVMDPYSFNVGCTDMSGVSITGNTLLHADGSGGIFDNSGVNVTPYHNATVRVRFATDVRIADNRIIQGRTDTSAIWLSDVVGLKEVKRNDMREVAHAYVYGANFDGSIPGTYDGSEVDACGNVTLAGAAQPQACP